MVSPVKILHLQTFKREYIPAERLVGFLSKSPNADRRIGALPYDWIKVVDRENIPDITRQTGDVFERFSKEIDEVTSKEDVKLLTAQQKLAAALKNILRRSDIRVSYAGNGSLKHCQRLDVGDYSYAFSTFKSEDTARKPFADYFYTGHGRGNEPQTIFTAYRRYSHGRIAKPFMANLCGVNDDGGYILSKFIDENHSPKQKFGVVEKQRKYMLNTDPNYIFGINIEAGGCIPNNKYIEDAQTRNIWLRFAKIIDSTVNFLKKNETNARVHQSLINLVEQGKDICSLDINTLPESDRKIAFRIVKSMKKVREYKEELIHEGKYEKIRELLNEDMIDSFPYDVYAKEFGGYAPQWYPALLADELAISNVPDLDTMMSLSAKYNDMVKIDFAKHYSKAQILEWINTYYVPERDKKLMENIRQQYNI